MQAGEVLVVFTSVVLLAAGIFLAPTPHKEEKDNLFCVVCSSNKGSYLPRDVCNNATIDRTKVPK